MERVVGVDRVGVDQVDAAADTDPLSKVLGASRAIHNVQHLKDTWKLSNVSKIVKNQSTDLKVLKRSKENFQTSGISRTKPAKFQGKSHF